MILFVFGLCFAGDAVVGVVEDVLDIVPVPAASNEMRWCLASSALKVDHANVVWKVGVMFKVWVDGVDQRWVRKCGEGGGI